jgi:hypothetical protein
MVKIEDAVRIQKLVHESMNRLKNRSESDESEARVHESYSQIFDSFDSRFIRKIRKIRVKIKHLRIPDQLVQIQEVYPQEIELFAY